jgi:hypothetical protein
VLLSDSTSSEATGRRASGCFGTLRTLLPASCSAVVLGILSVRIAVINGVNKHANMNTPVGATCRALLDSLAASFREAYLWAARTAVTHTHCACRFGSRRQPCSARGPTRRLQIPLWCVANVKTLSAAVSCGWSRPLFGPLYQPRMIDDDEN